jgi:hypothetical protein
MTAARERLGSRRSGAARRFDFCGRKDESLLTSMGAGAYKRAPSAVVGAQAQRFREALFDMVEKRKGCAGGGAVMVSL